MAHQYNLQKSKRGQKSEPYSLNRDAKSAITMSSILKRSTTLKKRLSELSHTPTKVRFQLPHTNKIRIILSSSIESKEYRDLVCLVRDSEMLDSDVTSLLKEVSECITLLNKKLRLFVEALLSISWSSREKTVVRGYRTFIVNLLSAHNYHTKIVMDNLVSLFIAGSEEPEWPDGKITERDRQKCSNVHKVIKVLLNVVPMCKEILLQSISQRYPYAKRTPHMQEYFLYNLLKLLDYEPSFRLDVFTLVISKLIVMDVMAPKEAIEDIEDTDLFPIDDIKSVNTSLTATTTGDSNVVARGLDICIRMLLEYISNECQQSESGDLDWSKAKSLYNDLIKIFDKIILPTYNIHHVQFIMFFLCAMKSTLTDAFITYLWSKVDNPNAAAILRQTAVTYIASLVARGQFISILLLKQTMRKMAHWIHLYLATQDGLESVNSDVRLHAVFYSVCQSLFYIIAFRYKDLVHRQKDLAFLESLQLGKMVTNRLNPLRVCQDVVVQNFAAITRKYQLAYCYTVIDHNSRNKLAIVFQNDQGSDQVVSTETLKHYYPFDPYVLPRSSGLIQPHYRDYQDEFLELEKGMDVDCEQSENDADDFLEHIHESNQKYSHNFSYGSSPGFKFPM